MQDLPINANVETQISILVSPCRSLGSGCVGFLGGTGLATTVSTPMNFGSDPLLNIKLHGLTALFSRRNKLCRHSGRARHKTKTTSVGRVVASFSSIYRSDSPFHTRCACQTGLPEPHGIKVVQTRPIFPPRKLSLVCWLASLLLTVSDMHCPVSQLQSPVRKCPSCTTWRSSSLWNIYQAPELTEKNVREGHSLLSLF